jgi:arsenite methyltransferase
LAPPTIRRRVMSGIHARGAAALAERKVLPMRSESRPAKKDSPHVHRHSCIVGILGVIIGLILLIYVPRLAAVAKSMILFAGFHIIGGLVAAGSLYGMLFPHRARGPFWRRHDSEHTDRDYDFGWSQLWGYGQFGAMLVAISGAVALQVNSPNLWPVSFLLVIIGGSFFVGGLLARSLLRRNALVVLPMVDLALSDRPLLLDAGCGSGRTTIALGRALRSGRIIALDRFDAAYIKGGGRDLLSRNVKHAGLGDRVTVETGDLTKMPFSEKTFDAAISTAVFDHLGSRKEQALSEICRVLKPGGRFLMAVAVPSWPMFAIGSVFSFFFTSRSEWREMAGRVGLFPVEEGAMNSLWYVLLEKRATDSREALVGTRIQATAVT